MVLWIVFCILLDNELILNLNLNFIWIFEIDYLDNKLSIWTRTKVVRRKHIIQPTCFGAYSGPNMLLMGCRGCASAMGVIRLPSSCSSPKTLCNKLIYYYISVILLSLQSNVFATFDDGSTMTRIHKWSMVIYGSLQAGFIENKHNGHIHTYGTYIFGNIVVNVSQPTNNKNEIVWRL